MVNRRNTVMVRLLRACHRCLDEAGMAGMLVDAIRLEDEQGLQSLGESW